MIRKNPVASANLPSLKNSKLSLDFDFGPLPLFSLSGFLKVLDLYVFSAICNLDVKLIKYGETSANSCKSWHVRVTHTKNINGRKKPYVEFYFDLFGSVSNWKSP